MVMCKDCQKDTKDWGHGYCRNCYAKARRRGEFSRSSCHPERGVYARDMCEACYKKDLWAKDADGSTGMRDKNRARGRKYMGVKDATGEQRSGKCDICMKDKGKLFMDHNHTTGVKRGWLCRGCNFAIGIFADDAAILNSALAYLKLHS